MAIPVPIPISNPVPPAIDIANVMDKNAHNTSQIEVAATANRPESYRIRKKLNEWFRSAYMLHAFAYGADAPILYVTNG